MIRLVPILLVAAVLAAAGAGGARADGHAPVVVELFTSEGCNSCPPADDYLAELAKRPDVLALSFHVDYWDYLGWTDRFAAPEFTRRQRAYATTLGAAMVYTPQAVVGGASDVIGSDRAGLDRLIDRAAAAATLDIGLAWTANGSLEVTLPAAPYHGAATVWFVRYDKHESSVVTAGENAGRTLDHANVVRELKAVGMWNGTAMTLTLPAEAVRPELGSGDDYGCAVIVQPEGLGPILAARHIDGAG
ncbi:MAG: DUF1223 domain-containing protein [Alphaproteobacteria bacterium]